MEAGNTTTTPPHAPDYDEIVGVVMRYIDAWKDGDIGDLASVLLGFDYAPDLSAGWIDIHALLRIDGRWWITNKTTTHCSMAGWAAPAVPT